jgi:hypothetical protein
MNGLLSGLHYRTYYSYLRYSPNGKRSNHGLLKACHSVIIKLYQFDYLEFFELETYCRLDDKIQNSGQNRKIFDKNVLSRLDKRYLDEGRYFRKLHQSARKCQLKRSTATAKIQRDVGLL